MDLETQEAVKRLAEENDPADLLVMLGAPDADSAGPFAETVTIGDPSYAGPLAETQLGLDVYHVLEKEIADEVPADVYDAQVGLMADVIDVDEVSAAVRAHRNGAPA